MRHALPFHPPPEEKSLQGSVDQPLRVGWKGISRGGPQGLLPQSFKFYLFLFVCFSFLSQGFRSPG